MIRRNGRRGAAVVAVIGAAAVAVALVPPAAHARVQLEPAPSRPQQQRPLVDAASIVRSAVPAGVRP